MRRFNARPLVVLSFFVAFVSAPVFAIDRNIQDKESYQPKASVTATNGILTVSMDDTSGAFTIRTGASHPQPNQNVFFPCCTSYLTVRDATAGTRLTANCGPGWPRFCQVCHASLAGRGNGLLVFRFVAIPGGNCESMNFLNVDQAIPLPGEDHGPPPVSS